MEGTYTIRMQNGQKFIVFGDFETIDMVATSALGFTFDEIKESTKPELILYKLLHKHIPSIERWRDEKLYMKGK